MRLSFRAGAVLAPAAVCAALTAPGVASAAPPTCDVPPGFRIDMEAGQTITLPAAPCSDADGDAISTEITQQPTHATISPSGIAPLDTTRTLTANSPGDDSISFRALAGGEASATVTVALHITTPVLIVVVPNVVLTYAGNRNRLGQLFTSLVLDGVPKGSDVGVRCKGSSCPRRRQSFHDTGRHIRLRAFEGKRLRPGTVLEATVTHDARVGVVKILKIRRGRPPSLRTLCMAPGSTKRQACS